MKRYVVGTLLFSIVMFVQLFGNIPVFADTFVPTSSYDFTALADLGYALVGGAEFDFDGTPYVIDNYNSLSAEQKEIEKSLAAREFLKDYMESRGIAFEENGELQKGSAYYTIAFGLAGQEFFEAFQTAAASEQENMEYNMPISPSRFADWAQYNKYWFNRYANDFADDSGPITPNPDPAYLSLLNTINPSSMWWFNGYYGPLTSPIYSNFSYFSCQNYSNYINIDYLVSMINTNSYNVLSLPIQDFYINSVNGTYYFSCPVSIFDTIYNNWSFDNSYYCTGLYVENQAGQQCVLTGYQTRPNISGNVSTYNCSGSLTSVLTFISQYFRNVNIYVDGVPWALVSNPAPANPAIPDFPDIINQETGDLAYDITMPKTSDYSGSFDLTSLFDAIREGIAGASDGDLATGSTIGSLDVGRTYTGEGIDIQDRVIDLTSSRVFDGTLTDDTTGRLPKPPVVPPAVSAGLGGVTVLAKYVDATQCILPDELMTAFWGCVWIFIILGLIKNLHR